MDDFIKELQEGSVISLSIGVRKSGKSYNLLNILRWSFENDIYDKYWLCLPVYDFESQYSYRFIREYKKNNNKKVHIYNKYSFLLTEHFLKNAKKIHESKERHFLYIDDASLSKLAMNTPEFNDFLAISRHIGFSVFICFHSLTSGKTLSPFLRQQCDYLMLYRIISSNLLYSLYEEYIKLSQDIENFKDFRDKYKAHTTDDFKSMLVNTREGTIDWDLKHLEDHLKPVKKKKAHEPPDPNPPHHQPPKPSVRPKAFSSNLVRLPCSMRLSTTSEPRQYRPKNSTARA